MQTHKKHIQLSTLRITELYQDSASMTLNQPSAIHHNYYNQGRDPNI